MKRLANRLLDTFYPSEHTTIRFDLGTVLFAVLVLGGTVLLMLAGK